MMGSFSRGGYQYALRVIEQKAKTTLTRKFKELDGEEKDQMARKVLADRENTVGAWVCAIPS